MSIGADTETMPGLQLYAPPSVRKIELVSASSIFQFWRHHLFLRAREY